MVNSAEPVRAGCFADKKSCYEVNGSGRVEDLSSEEKYGGLAVSVLLEKMVRF